MRTPCVYTASEIATWHVSEEYKPNHWRPARPCAFTAEFMMRLRIAWKVFTGKYDALNWGDKSGEENNSKRNYRAVNEYGFVRSGKL